MNLARFPSLTKDAKDKYHKQRYNAKQRGIAWEFTFETWAEVWERSGKWMQRGVLRDGTFGYVMSRPGDVGPYAPGNVKIVTAAENTKEFCQLSASFLNGRKVGSGKGWSLMPKKSKPYMVRLYGKVVGFFATQEDAEAAYKAAVSLTH